MKFFILIFSELVVVVDVPLPSGGVSQDGQLGGENVFRLWCVSRRARKSAARNPRGQQYMYDATARTHK